MNTESNTRTSFGPGLIDRIRSSSQVALMVGLIGVSLMAVASEREPARSDVNQVAGTWRMVSATLETNGRIERPYGENPQGMLVFTPDMHFVEVLTDGDTPRFRSDVRGDGSDDENRRVMASSIGFFGTYSVDEQGRFSGNRVEGATFPNWVGGVRTTQELQLKVDGERMYETFTRPDGGRFSAEFVRAR